MTPLLKNCIMTGLSRAHHFIIMEQIIHPHLYYEALKYAHVMYTFDIVQNAEFSISAL